MALKIRINCIAWIITLTNQQTQQVKLLELLIAEVDLGSIPSLVKQKTLKIGIH